MILENMNSSFNNQPPAQQQHPLNYKVQVPIFEVTSYPPQNFAYSTFSPYLSPPYHSHPQVHTEDRYQTDNDTGSEQSESEASILFPKFSTNENVPVQNNCIPSHITIPWSTFPYQLYKIHQDQNENNDQINFTSSTTKQRHCKPKIRTGTGKDTNVAVAVNPNPQKPLKNEKLMHCTYDDFPSANVGNTDISISPTMNKCENKFSNKKYESKSLEKPIDRVFQNTNNLRGPPNSKEHRTLRKFEFPTEYQYSNDNSVKTLTSCTALTPIHIINSECNLDSAAVKITDTFQAPGSKSNYKASTNSNLSATSKKSREKVLLGSLRSKLRKSSPDFKFLFKSNRQIKSIPYYRDCIDDENNWISSSITSTVEINKINLEQKETSNRNINQAIEPHVLNDLSQYLQSHLGDYECDSFTNVYSGSDFKNDDYISIIRNQELKKKALKNINNSSTSKNRNVGNNKGSATATAWQQDLLAEIFTHSQYHPQAGGSYVVEVASIKNNSNNCTSPGTSQNQSRKHSILKNGGTARNNNNINNDRIARKLMLPVGSPAKNHGNDLYSKQAKKQTIPSFDKCGPSLNSSVKKIPFTQTSPTPGSFQHNIKITPKQTMVVFQKKGHPHHEHSCIEPQDPRHQPQSQSQAHSSTKYYSPEIPPQSRGCDVDQTSARQSPGSSCNSPTGNCDCDHSRSCSPLNSSNPNIEGTNHTHHGYQWSPNNLNTSQPQWNVQGRGSSHYQNQTSCPCPCSSPRTNNCCYHLAFNNKNECSASSSSYRGRSESLSPPRFHHQNNHCSNSNRHNDSGHSNQCGSIQNHSPCNRQPHYHCHQGCFRACNYTCNLTNCKPQCPDSKNANDNCIRNEGRQRNPDTQHCKHYTPTSDRAPPNSSRGFCNNHQGGRPPSAGDDYCSSRSRREESKTRIPSTTPCRSVDNATWTRSRKSASGGHHGPPRLPLRPDRKSGHCYSSRRLSYCDPSCNDNKGDSGCPYALECVQPYDPCPCPEQYYPCQEPCYEPYSCTEFPHVPYIPMPSPPTPYLTRTPVGSPPVSLEWYPSCSVSQCLTPPMSMPPPPNDCFESPCEDPIIPPTPPVPMLVVPLPPPPRPRVFHRKVRKRIKPYKDIDYAVQPRKNQCPIFDCCGCDCCPNLRINQDKFQDQDCDYAQGECQEYWC